MANTRIRNARIDDETWNSILRTSLAMGVTASDVIRLAIADFLGRQDAA